MLVVEDWRWWRPLHACCLGINTEVCEKTNIYIYIYIYMYILGWKKSAEVFLVFVANCFFWQRFWNVYFDLFWSFFCILHLCRTHNHPACKPPCRPANLLANHLCSKPARQPASQGWLPVWLAGWLAGWLAHHQNKLNKKKKLTATLFSSFRQRFF